MKDRALVYSIRSPTYIYISVDGSPISQDFVILYKEGQDVCIPTAKAMAKRLFNRDILIRIINYF